MKRIGIFGILAAVLVGGCGVVCPPCPTCPSLPSPPQIVVRNVECDEIGDVLRELTTRIPRGVTQKWYDLTVITEIQRAIRSLFTEPTHVWIALGKLKEWGPTLPIGWAFDVDTQNYLIVVIVWEGRGKKAYFWNPNSLNFVPVPRNIFGIFV